ncbi:MAG: sigma 54-interacting transcriptional regulator, partial [Verrucomicrobiae bacterium]|nr:sigma 54-interacting transcriptional regulator [Verrucomicrobiae bacterium]
MRPARPLSIVPVSSGKPGTPIVLAEGVTTLGRDPGNKISLPDPSVSRRHAEILRKGDVVTIQDLNSRNGVKVNGVPRRSAVIRVDDEFQIGKFTFQVARPPVPATTQTSPKVILTNSPELEEALNLTRAASVRLSGDRTERHRDTLYHFAYWLTEGFDESLLIENCLPLLQQSLEGEEAHYYDSSGELLSWYGTHRKRPGVKLAGYLAELFQQVPEAAVFHGEDLRIHQKKAERYNYLTAPLRQPGKEPGDPCPFLVILRPAEWNDFDRQDRVLLQTISQLWARSRAQFGRVEKIHQEIQSLQRRAGEQVRHLHGASATMNLLRRRIEKVAATKTSVLVEGETGSGKEVVAQMIHDESPRREAPFVKMNCAAIPEGLIESELFGHVKGAFTDAKSDRRGKFEQADGGTIFLDEIGEMDLVLQAKLLRVLETGTFLRVGDTKETKVDVRIIAATNRNLRQESDNGNFRLDLYYRLSVFNIHLPGLSERREDIRILAEHFIRMIAGKMNRRPPAMDPAFQKALEKHSWPGNIRELKNVIERAVILASDELLTTEALPFDF